MRLLVIEDSDVDFLLIERALDEKFQVDRASSLSAGLELASRETFDLLILDLTIEDSRGFETFEKAHAALPRTPILVLTGFDDEELALRAVSSGALDRAARYAIERSRAEHRARNAEQRFQTLLDNLPTAAYTCDPQGLITYYNKKAVEMWGRAPRLNDPAYRFSGALKKFSAEGTPVPHEQSYMAQALAQKKGFNGFENHIELPDGQRRIVLTHANPVLSEDGKLLGGINVFADITQLRKAERELRESERFARAVVDSLPAHIAILDQNGSIIAVNAAWRRFAERNGLCSDGVGVGLNYLTQCDEADGSSAESSHAAAAGIRSVLSGEKEAFQLEYPCHSPQERKWFLLRVRPFEGDGPRRVVVSYEDITAQKLAEELAVERRGLREAMTAMERVLGVVGHELRTPLAAIRAMCEFLTTDGARNTQEFDEYLCHISSEVCRMSDTINNILEAARLNSGHTRWTWSQFSLDSVIADAVRSIRPLFEGKGVNISTCAEQADGLMTGDADAIRRLLINLLSNALKHTSEGQIEIRLRRFTDPAGQWIDLVVADTGCGIPQELTERLGEPFALNSGVVGAHYIGGAGLGLTICRGIAAAHGGQLQIHSIPNQGTTVTAHLRADLAVAAVGDTVQTQALEKLAA
jgi:signal transduction histidine kinase/CheY-like chemotaxis protein